MLTLPQPCLDRWQEKADNLQPFKNRYMKHQQSASSVFLRVEIDLGHSSRFSLALMHSLHEVSKLLKSGPWRYTSWQYLGDNAKIRYWSRVCQVKLILNVWRIWGCDGL